MRIVRRSQEHKPGAPFLARSLREKWGFRNSSQKCEVPAFPS